MTDDSTMTLDQITACIAICQHCGGTGNELYSMYRTCIACGGSGVALGVGPTIRELSKISLSSAQLRAAIDNAVRKATITQREQIGLEWLVFKLAWREAWQAVKDAWRKR